jgi:metallo-beta-lactamase class B
VGLAPAAAPGVVVIARVRLVVAALTLALATSAAAQSNGDERAAWNQPVKPFAIIGNVYYVGAAGISSFLITTPEGHVLLDGGLPETAPRIEANIQALGFKLSDVKFLINSHAHFDHAGGLAALQRHTGARLVASRADGVVLAAGAKDLEAVKVARLIGDGETVRLGGAVLTAHLTPGHTRGCTTWTMPVRHDGKTLQVLFHCSTTFPGYRLVDNPDYPTIASDYEHSFAVLKGLPCDVLLGPHGSFFDLDGKRSRLGHGGANPFVDPKECRAFILESEQAFTKELAKQRAQRLGGAQRL